MAGTSYTRQSTIADGNIITAALFNNEFNQLLNAFAYASSGTTGHTHDGSAGQGGAISKIGDQDFNNKVVISASNNRIEFYCEVSGSPVEQVRIQDGAIVPVTDSDVDLGTTSVRFKDAYIDSATVTGTVTANAISTSASSSFTGATFVAGTDVTFTGAAYNAVWDTSTNTLRFADNAVMAVGDSSELKIYHDGSNSYIREAGTGSLYVTADTNIFMGSSNGAYSFSVDGTGGTTTRVAGTTTLTVDSDGVSIPDNVKINIGSSDDLQIFHDGSNSRITDTGTGNLYLTGANNISLLSNATTYGVFGTAVELYYSNSKKFETTSSGATVSGSLTATGAANATAFLATTNIDTPQIEVTSLRARDGTVAGSIADSTGVTTLNSAVLTTADINGGTADNVVIGGSTAAAGSFTSVTATASSSITGSESSSTSPIATINRTGNDGVILELQQDGTTNAEFFSTGGNRLIMCDNTGDGLKFTPTSVHPRTSTNGAYDDNMDLGLSSSRFRDAYLGGGIYVGGTGSANYLDDYEEGDFSSTIGLSDGTNEATTSTSTFKLGSGTQAYYTKVGRMVTCNIRLNNIVTTGMTGSAQLKITNLPFNTRSSHVPVAPVYTVQVDKATAATDAFGVGSGNSDELPLRVVYEGGGTAALTTDMLTSGSAALILTLTYITP